MFADLMRAHLTANEVFLGHIGGDDFFLGVHGNAMTSIVESLPAFIARFASDMASFYDADARRAGVIDATDRDGAKQLGRVNLDALSALLAQLKKKAKGSSEKIAIDYFVA
jgi:hypothetical protein